MLQFVTCADKTPTPLHHLLKNCDEVGLFEDLKHVNPFDATFRQAIYSKHKRTIDSTTRQNSLELLVNNDEDTLHTPNIPRITTTCNASHNSIKENVSDKDEFKMENSRIIESADKIYDKNQEKTVKNRPKHVKKDLRAQQSFNDQVTKVFRKIYPKPCIIPSTNTPKKKYIKDSLYKLSTTNNYNSGKAINLPIIQIESKSTRSMDTNPSAKQTNKSNVSDIGINASKSADIIERNREAAKRYRHRQRNQHEQLLRRNEQLEAENNRLKRELQLMKEAHQNCIVTLHSNQKAKR